RRGGAGFRARWGPRRPSRGPVRRRSPHRPPRWPGPARCRWLSRPPPLRHVINRNEHSMSHSIAMKTAMPKSALRPVPLAASLALAVFLTGCGAVKPKPLTHDEVATRVRNDQQAMYKGQEPIAGALTLSDVMARSLKYNLDYRL